MQIEQSSPTETSWRSSGLQARPRTPAECPCPAEMMSPSACMSSTLTSWSWPPMARNFPEGETAAAHTRCREGSCRACTGSGTSQSHPSSRPAASQVTSSFSLSRRWVIARKAPSRTMWQTVRRSRWMSYVKTAQSSPAECTRCGRSRSTSTAETPFLCSANCSSISRERRAHTRTAPSAAPVTRNPIRSSACTARQVTGARCAPGISHARAPVSTW
mmetsp:Transcript_29929/g.44136  ORF Transcript_29929/g.44136 Transcript_29929/m.44136 type:complete len:217 (-) Transcript_29929:41-691(-)